MLHCPGVLLFLKAQATGDYEHLVAVLDSLILPREIGGIVDSPMERTGLALVRVNIYVSRSLVQCNAAVRCRNDLSGRRALLDSAGPRGGRSALGSENGRYVSLLQNAWSVELSGPSKTGGNSNMLRRLSAASTLLALPLFLMSLAGCSAQVGYRTYDPYYHDYHVYSDVETPYYNSWIVETHHPNVEYRRLNRNDREQYWRWRHDHK